MKKFENKRFKPVLRKKRDVFFLVFGQSVVLLFGQRTVGSLSILHNADLCAKQKNVWTN